MANANNNRILFIADVFLCLSIAKIVFFPPIHRLMTEKSFDDRKNRVALLMPPHRQATKTTRNTRNNDKQHFDMHDVCA